MRTYDKFYINGQWVEPIGKGTSDVINPATGKISARVPYGNADDVDAAVFRAESLGVTVDQREIGVLGDRPEAGPVRLVGPVDRILLAQYAEHLVMLVPPEPE